MRLHALIGNTRLEEALTRIESEGFASAILIDGPKGSGKKTAAAEIGMALLCTGTDKPCMVCGACRRVAASSHPDLFWLNREGGDIAVDDVRAMRGHAFVRPGESEHKVFIVNAADRMNMQAQNALLKMLEEPMASVFILLCENRESLLATVRSRCMLFRMEPLTDGELTAALRARFPDAPSGQLDQAVQLSGGFLGRALSHLEQDESKPEQMAREFVAALGRSELELFACTQQISRLNRDEYRQFSDAACAALYTEMKAKGRVELLPVYDALCAQRELMAKNASVSAMSGALCAMAGKQLFN